MRTDPQSTRQPSQKQVGPFVLEGRTVLCECPDCHGPMSVRLWLLEAECWQCGTRIEISEAQRDELEKILSDNAPAEPILQRIDPAQPIAAPLKRAPVTRPQPVAAPPSVKQPLPVKKPVKAPPIAASSTLKIEAPPVQKSIFQGQEIARQISNFFDWLERAPYWLVSIVVHLLVLLMLALLTREVEDRPGIVLSLVYSPDRSEGDIPAWDSVEARASDLPIPQQLNPDNPEDMGVIRESTKLADQLSKASYEKGFKPEGLDSVRSRLNQPYETTSGLVSRDMRVRNEVLIQQGGTLLTEAAVARALRWIADQQRQDGSWQLDSLKYDPGRGVVSTDQGATALALLPFLGAGQTHKAGVYRKEVAQGLRYLLSNQNENGDLRGTTRGEAGMYVHGQSTIVLCEAYALTRDKDLVDPVVRALEFILSSQHRAGGWRYHPGEAGDTSVLGWQLMALQSARMAGIEIPSESLAQANKYLDSASASRGARFRYQPGGETSPNMTAEGLLCRLYLGADPSSNPIKNGLRGLLKDHPPNRNAVDYYYWYYATQAFHHVGGDPWREWNESLRDILVGLQVNHGRHEGSWNVEGYLAEQGGRLYVTSLATCTLEVYYRHLPLFNSKSK